MNRVLLLLSLMSSLLCAKESKLIKVWPGILDVGLVTDAHNTISQKAYVYSSSDFSLTYNDTTAPYDSITITQVYLEEQDDGTVVEKEGGKLGYRVEIQIETGTYPSGRSIRLYKTLYSPEYPQEQIEIMLVGFKQ